MDLVLELLGNEAVLTTIAAAVASGIVWLVGKSSNSVDDKLAEKVAEKTIEKLRENE